MGLQVWCHSAHTLYFNPFYFVVSPNDYGSINVTLMFDACETRSCVNVTIENDLVNEEDENFFYTLDRTPGLPPNINLNPVDGEVLIEDDDGRL